MNPYPRLCRETQERAEAAARDRARRAFRMMLFWVGVAVFGAVALCVGLAARGDSGTWRLPEDRCDVAEINHFFDENGRLVFDQWIYYCWCDHAERHQVIAWRLHKVPDQWPRRDFDRGGWRVIWMDAEQQLRYVRIGNVKETWGQEDPELVERKELAREHRRELFRR